MLKFATKKSFKLFLRRLYLKTSFDREQVRVLQIAIEKDRIQRNTWFYILCVPLAYYLFVCLVYDPWAHATVVVTSEDSLFNNTPRFTTIMKNNVRKRWYQIRQTTKTRKPVKSNRTFKPGHFQEIIMVKLKKRMLETLQRNVFTPLESTSSTITPVTKPNYDEKELGVCRNNLNFTVNLILNASQYLADANTTLDSIYPMVLNGGYFRPKGCKSRHKVALIVPMHRNDTRNMPVFLLNIHRFLMAQKLEYQIFIIEQYVKNGPELNKGRLFNVGFIEMSKFGTWRCVVLHDVDLLPLSARVLYTCPLYPRHMSSSVVNDEHFEILNGTNVNPFGGVTAMTLEHYRQVNGHSNLYWGWGQDYDMYWRLIAAELPNVRYSKEIAKYYLLPRSPVTVDRAKFLLLVTAKDRAQNEGLNTIKYNVVSLDVNHLYTHIVVDINPPDWKNDLI